MGIGLSAGGDARRAGGIDRMGSGMVRKRQCGFHPIEGDVIRIPSPRYCMVELGAYSLTYLPSGNANFGRSEKPLTKRLRSQ